MSFQQGLSGLNATSKNLEVIGNNIANANTYGNKSSRAEFSDFYAAALNGSLSQAEFRKDPNFGFDVPVACEGVADILLDPRRTWTDPAAYDAQAKKLVSMFSENFAQYVPYIDDDVKAAAIG